MITVRSWRVPELLHCSHWMRTLAKSRASSADTSPGIHRVCLCPLSRACTIQAHIKVQKTRAPPICDVSGFCSD
eukprot:6240-Pyramimonas_sp.AAC.1